ncbi:SDR family NAD(P)-dependent oxidoreductase [Xanthomonas citri]|uniref:SDR family NAD(P)-dependent oxidoreductase n=1 Tax=Xanthomonas citri TaxID=346 RepID=UPI002034D8C4|nr:SDR family NAD(P)-dependent oxidoreductase [Xanthomonas citri]
MQARGAGMLSLTGACHAFDSRADGFVPGEAVGVVALKRLDDARADGDTIHGVILGIGINQDGSTQGITAPSMVSQQRLERQVYDDFRIDPARIQYVEAHGTGTRLGDPIEFQALTEAFRKDTPKRGYCAIGSIKTSIGHTASAAGVAGVLKILLALRHRQLPPSLHFRQGNPHIDFENSPFHVNTVLREWTVEPDERRCAAVSSFGISGTNAHAVIAEAPPSTRRHAQRPAYLIVLSARTSEQLRTQVERLLAYCRDGEHAADIGDISFTLLMGRRHLRHRIACVAASREELVGSLSRWLEKGRSAQVVVGSIRPSELREQASIRRHGNECIRASRDGQLRESVVEHLSTVADLFLQGYALDYADLFAGGGYGRVPLPTYAFSDDRYWVPSGGQAIPPPAQRSLPAIQSSASYSLLMTPTWRSRAAGDDAVAAGHRVLMLGDGADAGMQQACETALRSHDIRCDRWVGDMTDVAAVYEEAAWYLLRYLDAVREERPSRPVLVQVLAGQDAGGWLEGLLPLMATACQEIPNLRVQWVAVEDAVDDGETLVARLLRDAASGDLHVRHRHGVRETRQLEPVEATREAMPWKPGGVYLVTGGLGGLGQLFASEIFTRAPGARVVLAGRSALDQARSALLRDWAAEGHQVDYVAADVSRREDVEVLVGHILDRHGALDGVIHAAGVLRDGFIATKGRDDLAAVMAAKAHGLMHLDEVLGARALDAFLVFSSTSAAFGNAGQADYAAANGFVECFARWRQRRVDRGERHGRTLSVGWPLWSEGGMRISAEQRQRLREEQGLVPLETADGMATLYRAWGQGESCVTVLRLLSGSAPRVGEPRSDAILSDLDPHRIATQTLRALTAVFSEVTQQPPGQIDATEPLESYGVDSLVITQLNARLSGVFGKLSATLFYEYATLGDVASFLVRDHFDACARWSGESARLAPAVETGHQAAEAPPPIAQAPSALPAPRTAPTERAIAIVGLSGRYAGAADLDAFWDNLAAGRDSITEIPAERWSLEGFHEPDMERAIATGRSYSKWGGFLDGFAEFDSLFFNISPREAMNLDPQERIFLQACWAAMEHAGYTRERFARAHDRRVGVFAGITRTGFELHGPALWERGEPVMPHTSFGSVANRVSYALNLQGPSMPVDTMCSSSLTAIHEACEHLLRDDCEMAFAGGVNLYLHPSNYLLMSGHRMLSSSGRCHSFGADGDGFVPGEGVGVALLKPLARAEADGDAIHGVIRATAINHDGKTNGYTVPNPLAQRDLIATALARAGIPARAVSYVEAHGTGTQLGDPIEITGLTQAFATDERQFCAIGSAKSNIGHRESAAGIAGLTKVLLQMRHGQLVPSLHAATTNPNIDFAATPFRMQRTLAEWPRPRLTVDGQEREYPRLAGISSFGAGGANAHVIVEEYVAAAVAPVTVTPSRPAVVVLSARTDQALRARAAQLLAAGERWTDADLADVAYTLQVGREAMEHRLGFTAASMAALRASLQRFLAGEAGEPDADGEALHRGEVKAHKDALAIFSADEELGEAVAKWLARGKHAKVLELWAKGLAVDWRDLHVGMSPRIRPLPTYPFARERQRLPLDALAGPVAEAVPTLHPLVHRNTSTLREQRFSSTFTGEEFFLADHRVHGSRVLPGVACFEMAIEAAALAWERDPRASGDATFVLKDVVWLHPLRVDAQTTVHVRLVPTDTEDLRFEIYTRAGNATDDADETVHSRGTIAVASRRSHEVVDVAALRRGCDRDIDGTDCYAVFNATGVRYGIGHRGICRLHLGADARSSYVLAELRLPDAMHATDDGYLLHPGFLDSALQASIGFAMVTDAKRGDDAPAQAAMPFAVDEIEVLAPTPRQGHALVRSRSIAGSSSSRLDVEVCDERGRPCVIVSGLTCRTVGSPSAETSATPETTLLAPQWDVVVQPFGESWPAADARVLVIDGSDGQGVALTARYGQRVIVDAKDTDASLTRALASSATPYDHVVWIAPTISAPPGDDALIHAQEDGVVALYRLVKALLAEGYGTRRLGWTVLTTQSQRAWASDAIDPAHASVHGFIGSVAKEYPHWLLRLVDLGADGLVVPHDVLRLPSIASGDAWLTRGGEWFRQRWLPFEPRPKPRPVFRRGGVHVVVGGAGGLGQVFTEYLLREHAASVVWIGRRAQDAQIEAAIERLRAHGEPPLYIQADATQYDELNRARSAIVQRYGRIHGIVHSAIVLLDKSLANMDEDRFRAALRTKVDISVRMAQVFAVDEPEVVLFFSALQSFVKAAGQSNYAAGCTFKDAFAHALQSSWPSSVKTMNWGFWGSVGRVSSEDYAQRMRQMGIGSIEPEEGIHGLLSLLDADVPQLAMVKTLSTETLGALSANMGLRALPRSPHVDDRIADTPMVAAGGPASEDERANAWHATFHDLQLALLRTQLAHLGLLDAASETLLHDRIASAGIRGNHVRWVRHSLRILDETPIQTGGDDPWTAWRSLKDASHDEHSLVAQMDLVERALRALPDVLTGRRLATDVLFPDSSMGSVASVYARNAVADHFNSVLCDALEAQLRDRLDRDPGRRFRILEIGAGTGGTSAMVFERLKPFEAAIEEYTYTDVSRSFLLHAEDHFAHVPYLRGRLFNVEQAPEAQSMATGGYDAVIATNVLHATRNIRGTLRNAKATLKRGGLLLINEIAGFSLFTHLTFGLLDGWWLFEDDALRIPGTPGLAPSAWRNVLRAEGFPIVHLPAEASHALGQQVIVALSDGVIFRTLDAPVTAMPAERRPARTQSVAETATVSALVRSADTAREDDARKDAWVRRTIVETIAAALRVSPDLVDPDEPFADYGLDSIPGVHAVHVLSDTLGIALNTTSLFDFSTVNRLTGFILAEHEVRWQPNATNDGDAAATVVVGEPSSPTSTRFAAPEPIVEEHAAAIAPGVPEPIAIVGLSARYPHAEDADALWKHLAQGNDLLDPIEGSPYGRRGVVSGIERFDAMFFNISGTEATYMDPQQRLFLEEAWNALEDAGYAGVDIQQKLCGVYLGCTGGDYGALLSGNVPPQAFWGNSGSVTPSRIAYFLDLQGPALAIDTACSSSLVAIHVASQGLRAREVDIALAGGVFIQSSPTFQVSAMRAGMLSASGRCHTFDDRADGFVSSEGVGVVVLRRLADALASNDHIHGVIRGSGINQDGTTNGITAPSARSQERLHCQVYDTFDIDPADIQMVEAHGTGTKLGDPVEFQALTKAFRKYTQDRQYCAIGSIKTNLGHAANAAGVAGVIKVLLALRHDAMPASLHFEKGNGHIDFASSPFFVNTTLRPWPPKPDRKRLAAISSFGFSGTNAHLVIEEAPERQGSAVTRPAQLVVLSARSAAQLRAQAQRLLERLATWRAEGRAYALGDVSHTLLTGRRHFAHRLACVSEDIEGLGRQLAGWLAGEAGEAGAVRAGEIRERGLTERGPHSAEGESCLAACATLPVTDATAYRQRLERLAELFVQGEPLDYGRLFAGGGYARVPLPTYPFARSRYWVPSAPAPATETIGPMAPTRSAGTDDGMDETHEAAPAFPLSGALTLVPGWAPIATGEVPVARARHDGTGWAIVEDDPARQARWRARYPAAEVLTAAAVPARRAALAGIAQWFWMLPSAREPATGAAIVAGQAAGVMTGLALLQAFAAASSPLSLTVLTRRSQPVLAGEAIDPTHASVWGLLGSAAKEHPAWRLRLFDLEDEIDEVDEADAAPTSLEACLAWPADADGNGRAQRDGRWYRPVCVPCALPAASAPAFRTGGVYVLVVGAGELGQVLSEHLVRQYGARVVWLGRRAEDATIQARRTRLAAWGEAPTYLSVDARDMAAMGRAREAILARHGVIHGVVHATLAMGGSDLAHMDTARFEAGLSAKVAATVGVVEAFAGHVTDAMVFFSSIQALEKTRRQSNYAAGSTFLDAYVASRAATLGCAARVIDWGYWASTATAGALESFRHWLAEAGMDTIAPAEGLAVLERVLASPLERVAYLRTTRAGALQGVRLGTGQVTVDATAPPLAAALADFVPPAYAGPAPTAATQARAQALHALLLEVLVQRLREVGPATPCASLAAWKAGAAIAPAYTRWWAQTERLLRAHWGEEAAVLAALQGPADATVAPRWAAWVAAGGEDAASLALVDATQAALPAILRGEQAATAVVFPQATLQRVEGMYRGNPLTDHCNAVVAQALVHYLRARLAQDPATRLRVLEVGAGTGGTSAVVFAALGAYAAHVAEYAYTDLSKAFLHHAQAQYAPHVPYLRSQVFDLEKAPAAQGVDEHGYDVVIATNVVHATRDIRQALGHVKAVLKGQGILLLNELSGNSVLGHLTFGLLEGWWRFEDAALREPGSPLLAPARWARALHAEGYAPVRFLTPELHAGTQVIAAVSDGVVRRADAETSREPMTTSMEPSMKTPDTAPGADLAPAIAPAPANTTRLQAHVRQVVLETLSEALMVEMAAIHPDESFAEYGLDSLLGVRTVEAINATLGTTLTSTSVFDFSTVNKLTAHLVQRYRDTLAAALDGARATAATATDAPAPTAVTATPPAPTATRTTIPVALPSALAPIAIVGLSGRYPRSPDVATLWTHLAAGDDLTEPVTRWDMPAILGDTPYCPRGGFLDGIAHFDALFFNISGLEATHMDPQQRLFLEEAWKALEEAGHVGASIAGQRCGVYAGYNGGDYHLLPAGPLPAQAMWGKATSLVSARIAYHLDLQGPAITVDTACSSSLVAMHLACQALRAGEVDLALAGGVFVQSTPGLYLGGERAGMLSASGRCHTFDDRADGFVPGEGVGVVVLKRLDDALADGDHLHGVIRGSGINQDGATNGITAPSAVSQERLEREVYERFGIDADGIQLVEAHGTGTKLGDPIEFHALTRAFRQDSARQGYCAIGSIKTNLGHTTAASGVAGVLKVLLCLRHAQIAPSLHYDQANRHIDFADSPFYLPTALRPWTVAPGQVRRAAVSSFGLSGTNAHLVIEQAPAHARTTAPRPGYLWALSARSEAQLRQQVQRLLAHLADEPEIDCGNVSYTLLMGRKHFEHRLACMGGSRDEFVQRLGKWLERGKAPQVHVSRGVELQGGGEVALRRYGEQCMAECLPTLATDDYLERLAAIAELHVQGYNLDFAPLFASQPHGRLSLPTYPFAPTPYWVEAPEATASVGARYVREHLHPLLHVNRSDFWQQRYVSTFTGDEHEFTDHRVQGKRLLPGVAYLEMVHAATSRSMGLQGIGEGRHGPSRHEDAVPMVLRHVVWLRPIVVDGAPVAVSTTLVENDAGEIEFEIVSDRPGDGSPWVHAQGRAVLAAHLDDALPENGGRLDLERLRADCERRVAVEDCYAIYASVGIEYGPAHRGLTRVDIGRDDEGPYVVAEVALPACTLDAQSRYALHPSIMDAAAQAALALELADANASAQEPRGPVVPFAVKEAVITQRTPEHAVVVIRADASEVAKPGMRNLRIDICDTAGRVCVRLDGLRSRELTPPSHDADDANRTERDAPGTLLTPSWEVDASPGLDGDRHEALLLLGEPATHGVRDALRQRHSHARLIDVEPGATVEDIATALDGPTPGHVV